MKRLIIHIGYHKTATTTIQRQFFYQLHKDGIIEFLKNSYSRDCQYRGNIACYNLLDYIIYGTKRDEMYLELNEIKECNIDTILLSEENLSSTNFKPNVFLENKGHLNDKLLNIFGDIFDKIEIIITIRAQIEMIPSFYYHFRKSISGENYKFRKYSNWMKDTFSNHRKEKDLFLNYNECYDCYTDTFGKENVHVLLYEDLANDKSCYYDTFSDIFNVKSSYVKNCLHNKADNIGGKNISGNYSIEKETLRSLLLKPFRKLFRILFSIQNYDLMKKISNVIIPPFIGNLTLGKQKYGRALTKGEREFILERFKNSNKNLFSKIRFKNSNKYNYILNEE